MPKEENRSDMLISKLALPSTLTPRSLDTSVRTRVSELLFASESLVQADQHILHLVLEVEC